MPSHPIVHVDMPANDTEATAKFYEKALGWKLQHSTNFDYWMFSTDGGPGGGFVKAGPQVHEKGTFQSEIGQPLIYLGSDDIDADLEKVVENGGSVLVPQSEIPGTGMYAVFTDPSGNKMAFYKSL